MIESLSEQLFNYQSSEREKINLLIRGISEVDKLHVGRNIVEMWDEVNVTLDREKGGITDTSFVIVTSNLNGKYCISVPGNYNNRMKIY